MSAQGWRTVIVDSAQELALEHCCITAKGEPETAIPMNQVRTVIITSEQSRVSVALLK